MTHVTECFRFGPRTKVRPHLWWVVLALVLVQLTAVVGVGFASVFRVCIVLIGLVLFCITLFSIEKMLILVLVYLAVLPIESYRPPALPFSAQPKVVAMFILLLGVYWIARCSLKQEVRLFRSRMDWLVVSFLCMTVVAGAVGYLRSYNTKILIREFQPLAYYGIYFIVVSSVSDREWVKELFMALIAATVIISVEYVYVLIRMMGSARTLMPRVVTQQANLALIGIPFLSSLAVSTRSGWRKCLCLGLAFPLIVMAMISLQRALWIALLFSILVVLSLAVVRRRGFTVRRLLRLAVPFFAVVAVVSVVGIGFLQRIVGGQAGTTVAIRALTIGTLTRDPAVAMRLAESRAVMEEVRRHPFLGNGLGGVVHLAFTGPKNFADNSYITLWWKTGFVGLGLYLWLMAVFLQRCFRLYSETNDETMKNTLAGIIGCFAGLLVVASSSSILVFYRFNLIWGTIIGAVEILWRSRPRKIPGAFVLARQSQGT